MADEQTTDIAEANGHSENFDIETTEEVDASANRKVGAGQGAFAIAEDMGNHYLPPAQEMFVGSADPTIYLTHTRMSEKSIARTTRLNIWLHRFTLGFIDINKALVWKYNAEIGRDGKARTEYRQVATGQQHYIEQARQNGWMQTGRDIQKNPVVQRP